MIRFDYIKPASLEECQELLNHYQGKARLFAGGTDLMVEFRADDKKLKDVEVVLDISNLSELKIIKLDEEVISIGSCATFTEIIGNQDLIKYAPFLVEACKTVGSPQIRNTGTIGGSIGTASPASDPGPPLVAMNSILTLLSSAGEREVLLSDFIVGAYKTIIKSNELIKSIKFKTLKPEAGFSFVKLGRRKALAIARMNVAAYVETGVDGTTTDVRIVPGSATPITIRITEAENMLLGKTPSYELHEAVGKKVSEKMIEITGTRWSTPYKEPVIASLVKRALNQATGVKENG
ncbi:MAG: FAD binding domain-containing protein [Spirochaetales bacterium]|nr:FAD binding domain-containing protein [Spirochaetales bacterium]